MIAVEAKHRSFGDMGRVVDRLREGIDGLGRLGMGVKEKKKRYFFEETGIPALLRKRVAAGVVPGGDAKIVWDYTYGSYDPEYVGISLYFDEEKDERGVLFKKVSIGIWGDVLTIEGSDSYEVKLKDRSKINETLDLVLAEPGIAREIDGTLD